jgi:cyclic dehypoxanthinyl futalosine synthase
MTPKDALLDVRRGGRLAFDDALAVYLDATTDDLRATAAVVRDRHAPPDVATYLVDRNVNYTNVCTTDCTFCEFFRPPGHAEAYVLPYETLSKKFEELRALDGSRVLLQGGHHPDLRIEWYEDLLLRLSADFPTIELDAFSPSEIENLAALENLPTKEVLARLKRAGLAGLPGGGGEILDDEIRARVSPKKTKTAAWLRIMSEAHELSLTTTATMVFGFGEEPIHRLRSLDAVRRTQDASLASFGRGFTAFASWPLQYESRFGRVHSDRLGKKLGGTEEEYLRHTAFARVYLDNVPHFQASWPTMGLDVAREALRFGCDDMGGTMMEENVVSQAGATECSASPEALAACIRAAGLTPRRRFTDYAFRDA